MLNRRSLIGAAAGVCLGCGMRRANAAGRREVRVGGQRVRTVDIHCHCVIPGIVEATAGSPLEAVARRGLKMDGQNMPMQTRIAAMDAQGIDVEVMSINAWWYDADRDLARRIIDVQNEGLMRLCRSGPGRLEAFASVSMQFPELAAEQLEIGMRQQGLRGAAIGCSIAGDELSHPRFDPFWEKAEALQALVFLHPQDSPTATGVAARVKGYGHLDNVIANPLETTIALSHLIMDRTLDRFPKLRLCASHGGGYLPSYAGRLDQGCAEQPSSCSGPGPLRKPSEYLKQIYVDSLLFTPEGMRHVAAEIGPGQIMIGTDYGYPWVKDPIGLVLSTPTLSDANKIAILGGTAARLLKL